MGNWKTIESAPKDGSQLLLWCDVMAVLRLEVLETTGMIVKVN